ncbi:MAG: hypothetical protein RLZZ333_2147, partial [Bacteroidota bacterium]
MEKVSWKVDGMTCANCALTINKFLDKQGMQHIRVNPIDGDVSFELIEGADKNKLKKGIHDLGYHVADDTSSEAFDLGHVGEIESVDPAIIHSLLASGFVPVIAPIGSGQEGETYNINA